MRFDELSEVVQKIITRNIKIEFSKDNTFLNTEYNDLLVCNIPTDYYGLFCRNIGNINIIYLDLSMEGYGSIFIIQKRQKDVLVGRLDYLGIPYMYDKFFRIEVDFTPSIQ